MIAAITIPSLIAGYKREEASAKIKKFYSSLNQITIKAKADGNDWQYWADTTSNAGGTNKSKEFLDLYVLPYINYSQVFLVGQKWFVFLHDGSYFTAQKGGCIDIIYDINGARKPNALGRDQFIFLYCPNADATWAACGKIIPYQPKSMKTRDAAYTRCKSNGNYCSALLYFDSWEFKKDYPQKI